MRQKYFNYIKNPARLTLLTLGGSERNFYRVTLDGNKTLIYMKYTDEKEENEFYYDIYLLLKKLDIHVAEVYYKEKGNIFLEDLGDIHLYNLVTAANAPGMPGDTGFSQSSTELRTTSAHTRLGGLPLTVRASVDPKDRTLTSNPENAVMKYYCKVIDQLSVLHLQGESVYQKAQFRISNEFDYSLYRWESKYFMDNLIKNYLKIDIDEKTLELDFHFIADILSKEKRVLIHRDCQSKNIMIKNGVPYFIDFQGLRYGLPQYDLASLLEDPYVNLSKDMKEDLLKCYIKSGATEIYRYCSIQRLMQALGAYAFLGLKKGKKEFLQYIPNGLRKLKIILEEHDDLDSLKLVVYKILSL